jgi:rhodanese-related sulfurtransferase
MAVDTFSREAQQAIEHFERKLAFEIGPIGLERALQNNEPVQVVDLRVADLYAKGHVPGALNISLEQLEADTSNLSKDKTIVVYCYDIVCHLSAKAALLLAKKGFKVKELVGGFEDWAKHSQQIETSQATKGSSCGSSCG